jgi:hypothetical protein
VRFRHPLSRPLRRRQQIASPGFCTPSLFQQESVLRANEPRFRLGTVSPTGTVRGTNLS